MINFIKKFFYSSESEQTINIIKNAFLVDVRNSEEFHANTVEGAVNIPLDKLLNNLQKLKNKNNIVVFCRSGNRSRQAKIILELNGFTNIVNGGSWQNINSLLNK